VERRWLVWIPNRDRKEIAMVDGGELRVFLRSYDDDVEEKVFLIPCTSTAEMRTEELELELEPELQRVCWKVVF
jgi:hypothetical protein